MNDNNSTSIKPPVTELQLQIISAGAGSGKTYRLTSEMVKLLKGGVRASGIIATTFTKKAAAELQERVRVRLLEEGLTEQADQLTNALIGTVHGLGVKLLKRFAFEAGVSPEVAIIAEEDQQMMFNSSLAMVMTNEKVEAVENLCDRLGLHKKGYYDWRSNVMQLTDIARSNDFSIEDLEKSKTKSFSSFQEFLGEPSSLSLKDFNNKLDHLLQETVDRLESNGDSTKVTENVVNELRGFQIELKKRGNLYWWQLVKISKMKPGVKSREEVEELQEYVLRHEQLKDFQEDISSFINAIFDFSMEAIKEYDEYKKRRGLIDYTDMEVHIKKLLKNPMVQEVLEAELDLLMVDEFQDTSPLQLEIFLQLSKFAKHSIWVGDPKQSIYGFRGAEPKLMQAIIDKTGGVKAENIQEDSWRSREDIVFATNAIFCKAFSQLPSEQVALKPKRTKVATPQSKNKENEPIETTDALIHWHFQFEGGNRLPGKPWMENCIATALQQLLDGQIFIQPKDEAGYRAARPGDVAILCRSNAACMEMAEALHKAGLKAAISRAGLLKTAEAKLVLACMKFVLNKQDSLSIAEILLLSGKNTIEEIIENRLNFLQQIETKTAMGRWGEDNPFIQRLNFIREQVIELSSAEILDFILEELDLRRIIVAWGNVQPRLANVDILRKLALQYEEACNRLHSAASLGGFLLWLNELETNNKDMQGSGETADAVNVMTYHKSKGLEYPIVICHDLEGNLRSDVWGVTIVSEAEDVDLNNVLGHRWLRYWVNPYTDQFGNTLLEERIHQSPIKTEAMEKALQEEIRLLYVGLTRARDYLIFPTRARETKWLNRVCNQGNETQLTLDPQTHETPWEWNNQYLNIYTETFPFEKDFLSSPKPIEKIFFIEEKSGKKSYPLYEIDLNNESFSEEVRAATTKIFNYSSPIKFKEDEEESKSYEVAKALKAFLTADNMAYPFAERQEMALGFVERYELSEILDVSAILHTSEAWYRFLKKEFVLKKVHRKYPIQLHHHGRWFETIIDLVLETNEGWVIIQNSGFLGEPKKWRTKAVELGAWFYFSRMGVEAIFGAREIRTFVHFVLSGVVVEVVV